MTRIALPAGPRSLRRTRCNLAVLAALGLGAASPAGFAATAGTTLPTGTIPVLRGLVSDYAKSATFATTPAATGAGQTLTITQLLPKIILDWNSFDIGNGSTVEFVQPSSTSAALNRIHDQDPTIIQGRIKANGQVFLVNQNGILFDRGTQIDTNTFVASTLNITDAAFQAGMASGGTGSDAAPAFAGGYDATGQTIVGAKTGAITIGANGPAGAASPAINAAKGGAVVIIAPMIDNRSGVITSPDGQVILAAGNSAYLGFTARNESGFRGMLVEVRADAGDVNLTSLVRNEGTITSDRGNVTMAGLAINQAGRVSASSAMLTNGSIWLQARTKDTAQVGTVTLAAGSVTETPLDLTDTSTMREGDNWTPYRPVVNVEGGRIDVEGRIASPSGAVTLTAENAAGQPPAQPSTARVYLGAGSTIDASGAWSEASDASNLLTFKVTSTELKTSPDQQGGLLLGATVTVDLRTGSPLLDLSGYQANQARTLVQKAAAGGSVAINSAGDVVQHSDATVDVSGGGVHYTGATEATTKLLGADGKLYDIGSAPEALRYTAIASSFTDRQSRWGYDQTYSNLLFGTSIKRPDFTEGSAGGALQVGMTGGGTNGLVLDGTLLGGVTVGSQQLAAAPIGGSLVIGAYDTTKTAIDTGVGDVFFLAGPQTTLPAGFGADTPLADARKGAVELSTDVFSAGKADASGNLVTTGFGSVTVNANGKVTVPENVRLDGPAGGTLVLQGNQVEIDGHVGAAAGSVTARTLVVPGTPASPVAASGIVVAGSGTIDTSGSFVNGGPNAPAAPAPTGVVGANGSVLATRNGGTVALEGPTVDLQAGSRVDVSAGGVVSAQGAFTGGAGGAIALAADKAQDGGASPLTLAGTLAGYGFTNGGSLSLATQSNAQVNPTSVAGSALTGLELGTAFFGEGGFQSYKVSAAGDVTVIGGAVVLPRQVNLQVDAAAVQGLASGADVATASRFVTLRDWQRPATSLALASTGGSATVQAGSGIGTDVGGAISITGQKGVDIEGTLYAPSGTIALGVAAQDSIANLGSSAPAPVLAIGAKGIVSTRGGFVATPSDKGLVQGRLGAGGTVTLSAQGATIVAAAGSAIDVSGARQVVDLPSAPGSDRPTQQVVQASNAGTLAITANDSVTLDGAIRANADGSAAGGSFALTLTERGDYGDPASGRRIVVTQSGAAQPAADGFKDVAVSVDRLAGSGFDKLRLTSEDQIVFGDSATLAFQRGVTLDTKLIQVAGDASVVVSGANVKLADSFGQRVPKSPGDPSDPRTVNDATLPSLVQAPVAGNGQFKASAGTLDVVGSVTIGGTASETLVAANDLRLSGRSVGVATDPKGASLVGSLTTAGDLTLVAAQVYPTTASTFTVQVADGPSSTPVPGGTLTVSGSGAATPGDVYSAGGSLTMIADRIAQDGVVKAPLGNLALQAGQTLTLGAHSVTSVSANGLVIPYGETQDGITWTYAPTGSNPLTNPLAAPPAKKIALTAPAVDVLAGATVDVSGGGDVAGIEYVPSTGASKDALVQPGTYAIVPKASLTAAPVDPDMAAKDPLGFDKDGNVYDSVRIGAGGPVPAGDYVLLPGYYALLKGGYVVQLLTGSTYANLQPGQTATLQNGLTVVPGVMTAAGTDVAASATIGVVVRPNSDIPKLGEYTVANASFFAALADANRVDVPALPTDGGQLQIAAAQRLTLNGTLVADLPTAASRSAQVDIAATKIALVDQVGRGDVGADFLQVDSSSLSRLNASLLIGGVRATGATGEVVTPSATDIVVANSASHELKAPELVLVASDSITVQSGSLVEGAGGAPVKASDFTIAGPGAASGAVLRVSNAGLVKMDRPLTDATRGSVDVQAGATISATGSIALDATRTTSSRGTLDVAAGGALALVSGTVSLGQTADVAGLDSGLVLDNAQLAGFDALGTLSIRSYGGIDLYGSTQVGSGALANLVLDGAAFTGHRAADGTAASTQVAGRQVTLLDTSATSPAASGAASGDAGAGAFSVSAGTVTLGAGAKVVAGFSDTRIAATGAIVAAGTGSLQAASSLELQAARIDNAGGANQAWSAQEGSGPGATFHAVTITAAAPDASLAASTGLGSRLAITGSRVDDAGTIVMQSGAVTLQALGGSAGDGVTLASGASIQAGGASRNFQGEVAVADAGSVSLAATNGAVTLAAGSTVDVSASTLGGNAGTLAISGASAQLAGRLAGGSALGTQGSASLDVATLPDFSTVNATLNGAGFTESRDVRVRAGDLVVGAADVVQARHVTLESDAGRVAVAGRIDANGTSGGGSIAIAGRDVRLASTALLDASGSSVDATAAAADGGHVAVVATGGTLAVDAGAVIDVRAGARGAAGDVLLRAPRTADSLQATLAGQVLGQRHAGDAAPVVAIEGNRVYDATGRAVDATAIAGYAADDTAWMSAVDAATLAAGLRGDDGNAATNVHVRPAVEVRSSGDLAVTSDWNLAGAGWRVTPAGAATPEAGSLVVRAAGDLVLQGASIGNPDARLQSGPTWNIALTSGADLAAAGTARTQSAPQLAAQAAAGTAGAGDLVLASTDREASVRTGTGTIRLAAGRDFVIKAGAPDPVTGLPVVGVVTTSGVAAVKDSQVAPADARFTTGGGDVAITAGRDAVGAGNEWMTEWFRSPTDLDAGFASGAWWVNRAAFHDGVAALGGGDVSIRAGRDVVDLSAWSPTSAMQVGSGAAAQLATWGGGNVDVHAGNDVVGGQFMISLGKASITAGGDIGGQGTPAQLFVMGAGGDPAQAGTTAALRAGGAITLNTIDNPSSLLQLAGTDGSPSENTGNPLPVMSATANGAVALVAGGGDIRLGNRPAASLALDPTQQSIIDGDVATNTAAAVLPARVDVTAFAGSIVGTGSAGGMTTFPSADGRVKLLAGKGIAGVSIAVSDADASRFEIRNLAPTVPTSYSTLLQTLPGAPGRLVDNTSPDRFIDDVVALGGDIQGVTFAFPARSRLWAAGDIANPSLRLQNLQAGDLTALVADGGSFTIGSPSGWAIDGPGTLMIQAGQDIRLGKAVLSSYGNLRNGAIRDPSGADIALVAGTSGAVDPAQLDATFAALVKAGSAKSAADAKTATDALFAHATVGRGDIDSYSTSIQSNAGGDIDLLAPGGNITVGLPTPNTNKLIGVVTNVGGAIRSYLSGDFDINQGKVLTAQGGDILIYTAQGSIDAGRGAKTSVTTPPPTRTPLLDADGNVIGYTYTLPVAVAGSGIQTATSQPNGPDSVAPPAGNIYLFAPAGTIDAGEAGIKSGGAIFIAALTVLNADNISSVGASVGVPQVQAGSVASSLASSGATTAADAASGDAAAQAAQAAAAAGVTNFRPAILTVEVLGFGEKACKETDRDCFAK